MELDQLRSIINIRGASSYQREDWYLIILVLDSLTKRLKEQGFISTTKLSKCLKFKLKVLN